MGMPIDRDTLKERERRKKMATREEALEKSLKKCKELIGYEINQVSTEMIKGLPVIKLYLRKGVDNQEVLITSNQKGTKAGFIK